MPAGSSAGAACKRWRAILLKITFRPEAAASIMFGRRYCIGRFLGRRGWSADLTARQIIYGELVEGGVELVTRGDVGGDVVVAPTPRCAYALAGEPARRADLGPLPWRSELLPGDGLVEDGQHQAPVGCGQPRLG